MLLLVLVWMCTALGTLECHVCEDVMQTIKDRYSCVGKKDITRDLKLCGRPMLEDCRVYPHGAFKKECFSVLDSMRQPDSTALLWESMVSIGKAFRTCEKLGHCSTADEPCHSLMGTPECEENPLCKAAMRACRPKCHACAYLVKDWPIFQGVCKPPKAKAYSDIEMPTSFLELERLRAQSKRTSLAKHKKKSMGRKTTPKKVEVQCREQWNAMLSSPKALYYATWSPPINTLVDDADWRHEDVWSANTVCKCLDKCPATREEKLGLNSVCQYSEPMARFMKELYSHIQITDDDIWGS